MTSAEWTEPMPSVEPSTDLFDGDILGDELIDIYNAAVVGGGDDDALNEIPTLLASPAENIKKESEAEAILSHPAATSSDDGLGAFRPSTSFNDLTTLLPPATSAAPAPASAQPLPSVVSSTSVAPVAPPVSAAPIPAPTNKRAPETAPAEVPAAKRRASASKKNATTATAKSKTKAVGAATQASKKATPKAKAVAAKAKQDNKKNDTPNPLTIGKTQPPTLAAKVPAAKGTALKGGPAVVTPRVQGQVKDSDPSKVATAPVPPLLSNPPTEADFKSVAQAAVSNLIMNAGNAVKADAASTSGDKAAKVDTSTEHIKALTGSNWVAVCSGGDSNNCSNANADKMNNRARRQNLTPDERARQNRDRNREHARNTRLRKKAYVEELKRTLTALVSQRDATELEKRHSVQRELEQREVRFRVIEEFLKLRGRNEVNFARWAAILEDSFSLTLPVTDFRSMVQSDNVQSRNGFEQVLTGVSEAMADSNLLAGFVQSLTKHHGKGDIGFAYNCDRKNFFMDNCNAVLDWTASTHGAVKYGASSELTMKGNLKANFSPASNKLVSVVITFDTGGVVSQINHIFKDTDSCHDDVEAAQVAASEADAILDSLQMPHIDTSAVPSNVNVVPASVCTSGAASITDVEKEDSSDESNGETDETGRLIKTEA